MATLTITSDHEATFSDPHFCSAGQRAVSLTVNVDATIQALAAGKLCYLDFLLPNGTIVYKGFYDCSSGTFTCTIGDIDLILVDDGALSVQLVICDAVPPASTYVWKSNMETVRILPSVSVVVPTPVSIVSPATEPTFYPAGAVTIVDAGTLYVSTLVEDALAEAMVLVQAYS